MVRARVRGRVRAGSNPKPHGVPGDDHDVVHDDDEGVVDAEGTEGCERGGRIEEQAEDLVRVSVRVRVRVRVRQGLG